MIVVLSIMLALLGPDQDNNFRLADEEAALPEAAEPAGQFPRGIHTGRE